MKEDTLLEYQRRIHAAMNFITEHIHDDPSLEDIASHAAFSKFHFHRLFKALVGETVHDFKRRIRLEHAAQQLLGDRSKSITSIAHDYQFSSSQNFAKAFRKHFGLSPSAFRKQESIQVPESLLSSLDASTTLFSILPKKRNEQKNTSNAKQVTSLVQEDTSQEEQRSFLLRRNSEMKVKIEDFPSQRVAYVRNIGPYTIENAGDAFEKLMSWSQERKVGEHQPVLGTLWDLPELSGIEHCRYDACIYLEEGFQVNGEIAEQILPGGLYACYHCTIINHDFESSWDELLGTWLPLSGYQPGPGPAYEFLYNDGSHDPEGRWIIDLCVPLLPL